MCFSYVCSIGACLVLSVSSSFLRLGWAGAFTRAVIVPCGGRKKSIHTSSYSLAPDPFFIFLFSLFLLLFLRGHNTCMACRIFVYFSPLARRKVFCSAIGNLKLD